MVSTNSKALRNRIKNPGEVIFDQEHFRAVLREHVPGILKRSDNLETSIDKDLAIMYQGDFYGLLERLNVPKYLHWLVTVLNGYDCSYDYDAQRTVILVPAESEIARIKAIYTSVYNR